MTLRLPDRPLSKSKIVESHPLCRVQFIKNMLTEMRAACTTQSHKRDQDEFLTTSSDPPMFSSDPPLFATSVDDYQQPVRKRQRKGVWYELEEASRLRVKKNRKHPGLRRAARQRRPFRKFDSGVYMGSDESTASESSNPSSVPEAPLTVENSITTDQVWDRDVENLEHETLLLRQSAA